MNSLILRTATVFILPLLLLVSLVILLRGHNEPGGGFVGGLTAATAILLHMLAFGPTASRQLLPIDPRTMIGTGLLFALISGLLSLLAGAPGFTAVWTQIEPIPGLKVGTPLVFDAGVYLTVTGVVVLIVFSIAEYPGPRTAEGVEGGS